MASVPFFCSLIRVQNGRVLLIKVVSFRGRKLAEEAAAIRSVLLTTGFTRNAIVHNGIRDCGVNFLAKPFSMEQLAVKMRDTLGAE